MTSVDVVHEGELLITREDAEQKIAAVHHSVGDAAEAFADIIVMEVWRTFGYEDAVEWRENEFPDLSFTRGARRRVLMNVAEHYAGRLADGEQFAVPSMRWFGQMLGVKGDTVVVDIQALDNATATAALTEGPRIGRDGKVREPRIAEPVAVEGDSGADDEGAGFAGSEPAETTRAPGKVPKAVLTQRDRMRDAVNEMLQAYRGVSRIVTSKSFVKAVGEYPDEVFNNVKLRDALSDMQTDIEDLAETYANHTTG